MTIKTDELILAPPLQQSVIDPLTRLPAVGTLYFKSALTQKPKAVYIATGDTQNPYQGVTQIRLNNAGALPHPIYCYPFDETDDTQSELYDIALMNDAGQTIFTRNNFPQTGAGDGIALYNRSHQQNLCPSYGFNSPIHPTDFSEQNGQAFNQAYNWCLQDMGTPIAYGWNLWAGSDVDYRLYYEFQEAPANLAHNPQYELLLTVQDAQPTATSFVRLGCKLGAYNAFQGKTLRLSHYLRWLNSEPFGPINIVFLRTKNGKTQSPISLGTLTASPVMSLQQQVVTIPPLPETDGYTCDDVALLYLDFPTGVDFKMGITANWYQVDTGQLLAIETSHADNISGAFFGGWTSIGDSCLHQEEAGLPTAFRQGQFAGLNKTGEIVQRLKGADSPNYAVELSGGLYYWDDFVDDTGIKINRLVPALSALDIQFTQDLAQPLFYSNLKNNEVDLGLKNGEFTSEWDASQAPTILLSKSKEHYPYDIRITKNSATEATIKYVYNWHPNEQVGRDWYCRGRGRYIPIADGPIGNWDDIACDKSPYGTRKLQTTILEHGSDTKPPAVKLTFTSENVQDYATYFGKRFGYYQYRTFIEIPTQDCGTLRAHPYYIPGGSPPDVIQGAVHIVFTGDITQRVLPGKRSTLNIDLKDIQTTEQLIDVLVTKTGGGEAYHLKITALPRNGAVLKFSNNTDDYALLFHQIGLSFPSKPTGVENVLVLHFHAGMDVNELTKQIAIAMQRWIIRIPQASDLGLDAKNKKYGYWLTL